MPRTDNETFYISALKKYGVSPKGVHWNSKRNQELRFDVLLEMLPKNLSKYSVVDIGCGFGDLYLYMAKKNRLPKSYTGIDSLKEMCTIATERTKQSIVHADAIKDTLPHADFYICSGAMNILTKFETFVFIRKVLEVTRVGFVFNALHGVKESDVYNYLSFDEIYNLASDFNADVARFDDDYLENDISVLFHKGLDI